MTTINKFLTPPRRKAIYGLVAALVAILIAFEAISATELTDTITAIVSVLGGLASVLAFSNVSPGPHDEQ
jgi:hypothetical protein